MAPIDAKKIDQIIQAAIADHPALTSHANPQDIRFQLLRRMKQDLKNLESQSEATLEACAFDHAKELSFKYDNTSLFLGTSPVSDQTKSHDHVASYGEDKPSNPPKESLTIKKNKAATSDKAKPQVKQTNQKPTNSKRLTRTVRDDKKDQVTKVLDKAAVADTDLLQPSSLEPVQQAPEGQTGIADQPKKQAKHQAKNKTTDNTDELIKKSNKKNLVVQNQEGELILTEPKKLSPSDPNYEANSVENFLVKKVREESGLSQREFAKKLDISLATLKSWEQRVREPSGAAKKLIYLLSKRPSLIKSL